MINKHQIIKLLYSLGGKNLTIRGQHTWRGLHKDLTRGLEVGESNSIMDFIRSKYRDNNDEHAKIVNYQNRFKNVNDFVIENTKSKWASKDSVVH